MHHWLVKTILALAAAVVAVVVVVVGGLYWAQARPDLAASLIEHWLAPPGGSAALAELDVSASPPRLRLGGLAVSAPPGAGASYRLERLAVALDWGGLWSARPWLAKVEASGLEASLPQGEPTAQSGPPDLEPMAWLLAMGSLRLDDARVSLTTQDGVWHLERLAVAIVPEADGRRRFSLTGNARLMRGDRAVVSGALEGRGHILAGPRLEAELDLPAVALDLPGVMASLAVSARLDLSKQRLELTNLAVHGTGLSLAPPAGETAKDSPVWRPASLELAASGGLDLDGARPALQLERLALGELLSASGKMAGQNWSSLEGAIKGRLDFTSGAWTRLKPLLPGDLEGLAVQGTSSFEIAAGPGGDAPRLELRLKPQDLALTWPRQGLHGSLAGDLTLSELTGRGRLGGRFNLKGDWRSGDLILSGATVSAGLAGDLAAPGLLDLEARVPAGGLSWQGRALPLGEATVRGDLALDADGLACLTVKEVRAGRLGELTGQVLCTPRGPEGRLSGGPVPAADLLALALPFGGGDPSAWTVEGGVGLVLDLKPGKAGPSLGLELTPRGLGLASPDGKIMAQGLDGSLTLGADLGDGPRFTLALDLPRGEALYDTIYLKLDRNPLALKASGRYADGGVRDLKLTCTAGGLAKVTAKGQAAPKGGSWFGKLDLVVDEAQLEPLFKVLVTGPLAATRPDLAGLAARGQAHLKLALAGSPRRLELSGGLRISGGGLGREGEPAMLEGLELDLPLAYVLGGKPPAEPVRPARMGSLSLAKLRLGDDIQAGPWKLAAALVPNRLTLDGELSLPLFGGALSFKRIAVDEPLSPEFKLGLNAALTGLDLAKLPPTGVALSGHLAGDLGRVRLDRAALGVPGGLAGTLFGGALKIDGLGMRNPLSPGRELAADLQARGVHLDQLSRALDVGKVTGRMDIVCNGLRIAYGQPVAFDLRVLSVPAEDVEQTVSLKAVNSISVVGTGSGLSGTGISLMKTFFDEFPYEKIGFACKLKNDVFTIKGLILEDGTEYLVKRPLFRGINVINMNKDNRISFKGMLDRLARLGADNAGPEIR